MKIPLCYPKIPDTTNFPCKNCIAFEKMDGTLFFFEWDAKQGGWYAFGVRRDRYPFREEGFYNFHINHKGLKSCIVSFLPYKYRLDAFFRSKDKYRGSNITVFMEYFGANSFAGEHIQEEMKLILFDVQVNKRILTPQEFLFDFKQFPIAKVIYKGKYSGQLVEDIRKGKYAVKEGAVIKGTYNGNAVMCKVKTDAYLDKLKERFGNGWSSYWE